jgi:hypothetical protein
VQWRLSRLQFRCFLNYHSSIEPGDHRVLTKERDCVFHSILRSFEINA